MANLVKKSMVLLAIKLLGMLSLKMYGIKSNRWILNIIDGGRTRCLWNYTPRWQFVFLAFVA